MPTPFLVLEIAALICTSNESFESSTMPRCLCIVTLSTGTPLKKISGCWTCTFVVKNLSLTAHLDGCGLNDILQFLATTQLFPNRD